MSKAKMKARKAKRAQQQRPQQGKPCPHTRYAGHAICWTTLAKNGKTTKIIGCATNLAKSCPACRFGSEAEKTGETVTSLHLLALEDRAVEAMAAAGDPSIAMLLALPKAPVNANFDTSPLIGETHRATTGPTTLPNGWTVGAEIAGSDWTMRADSRQDVGHVPRRRRT